ncbi:hypothetical protein FZEAL_6837 [Fusarium zealandicum]|uniref:Uncharacterized protein n=1 Tax=Fusarium zealandicum TaxID=1053134 RepID=A0A8H4UHR4_9HYPO|nr:hypothetical protein FZEAL_6837 [Fusarium zealandicum]
MCTLVYRKYDCTKCQRRIRDDKWIEDCERVREGRKGTCEPQIEVMAEEAAAEAAEQEKKDKGRCSAI